MIHIVYGVARIYGSPYVRKMSLLCRVTIRRRGTRSRMSENVKWHLIKMATLLYRWLVTKCIYPCVVKDLLMTPISISVYLVPGS